MSLHGPDRINLQELPAWFDALFSHCTNRLAADALHYVDGQIANTICRIHASNRGRVDFIRSRLDVQPSKKPVEEHWFSLSGDEIGWRIPLWDDPNWNIASFNAALASAGYKAHPPFFDRDWIVQRISDGMAIHIVPRWDDLRPWDGGAPLRWIVHWSAQRRQMRLIHAGTLATQGHGVLLCGAGGAGKSGTVLSGLAQGLSSVGDDYILLDQRDTPRAERIYTVMKQDDKGLARFPDLDAKLRSVARNWQGKAEFDPRHTFPGQIISSFELVAIILPRVAAVPECELKPMARRQALDTLTRAMNAEFFGEMSQTLFTMNRLLARLPAYELALSRDPADIAQTITRLIFELTSLDALERS